MSTKEILKKINRLELAFNDYFLKLNEHSVWLFLSMIGWLGIPETFKYVKIIALLGILLFFYYLISKAEAWKIARKTSFIKLIQEYKCMLEESDLSHYKKRRGLEKLTKIEDKYFMINKNWFHIITKNYCFFFTIFFVAVAVVTIYGNFKLCGIK